MDRKFVCTALTALFVLLAIFFLSLFPLAFHRKCEYRCLKAIYFRQC